MASKDFLEIADRMKEIHIKKNADYATTENPFINFEICAEMVAHFNNPIDQVFVTLIAVKMARLSNLLNNNKIPENESIIDTFIDGPNYFALWGAWYKRNTKKNKK